MRWRPGTPKPTAVRQPAPVVRCFTITLVAYSAIICSWCGASLTCEGGGEGVEGQGEGGIINSGVVGQTPVISYRG